MTSSHRRCHRQDRQRVTSAIACPTRTGGSDRQLAAKNTKLKTLLDRDVRQFLYTYEMGDDCEHIVTVEALRNGELGTKYPRHVEGERRAPSEDYGGTPGFEAFLEATTNPNTRGTRGHRVALGLLCHGLRSRRHRLA
jgi:hypothetical protein